MRRTGIVGLCGWFCLAAAMMIVLGCDSPTGSGKIMTEIGDILPPDGAADQDLNLTLRWAAVDDTLKTAVYYRLYLGRQSQPPLVVDSLHDNTFMPGPLEPKTSYRWRVQAYHDSVMIASSPLMRFTTGEDYVYPLAVGLFWDYWHETYSFTNGQQPNPNTRDTGRVTVAVWPPLIIFDTILVYNLSILETTGQVYRTSHAYLNNTERGLYTYYMTGTTLISPRPMSSSTGRVLHFAGRTFASPAQLFAFLRAEDASLDKGDPYPPPILPEPTRSYAYPLSLGSQWTYRFVTDDGEPWRIDKKVIRRERVTIPAGTFDCFVIQWFWDLDEDGQWDDGIDAYDYLAPQGLVKREFYVGKVGTTSYENPDGIDYYDFYDGYTLTGYGRSEESE